MKKNNSQIQSVRFEDVSFHYEQGQMIFENLTFDVPMGGKIFVTGPDGNGQSTFLKLLAVLVQPQSGKILINGVNSTEQSFEEFLPLRMKIGYTFDYGGLFSNRSLMDNLTLGILYHNLCSEEEARDRVRKLACDFNFIKQVNQRPAAVSGGLRKLICVLRAFLFQPEMLVMDDPSTGIGPDCSKKLIEFIDQSIEAGWLKHMYITSRDSAWPADLGCKKLFLESERFRLEEKKAA